MSWDQCSKKLMSHGYSLFSKVSYSPANALILHSTGMLCEFFSTSSKAILSVYCYFSTILVTDNYGHLDHQHT